MARPGARIDSRTCTPTAAKREFEARKARKAATAKRKATAKPTAKPTPTVEELIALDESLVRLEADVHRELCSCRQVLEALIAQVRK